MFDLTALELARIQFGFTVSFHIIFPTITIGLASYLAVLEGLWLWRKNPVYRSLHQFWSRIFAVNFAMGVVSGLVMAYQFGTNWSNFSAFAGSITGPLLTYEVLTAFFLEAGFLGVALFGGNKVEPGLHFFATLMVALRTLVSVTWILASNSWMQTPQGYEIIGGRVVPVDWLAVIFNPAFPYRLAHMTVAAYLATALFVGASGAWHLLKRHDDVHVRTMLSMAMWMILVRGTRADFPRRCPRASTPCAINRLRLAPWKGIGRTFQARACRSFSSADRKWRHRRPATHSRFLISAALS